MNAEQVAETIKQEFKVPCIVYGDYFLWNAPYGVYDAELREFRKRVHQRIEELEAQEEVVEMKG
jgi:hypothetical protein